LSAAAAAAATAGATILCLPARANEGGWDKLYELGVKPTVQDPDGAVLTADGKVDVHRSPFRFARCQVPAGWELRDSGVSLWQKRLFDGDGRMLAKVFYKPTGGGGSIHVFLTEDDPMAEPDVIPAFTAEPLLPAPTISDGEHVYGLARRLNPGGREHLVERGVKFLDGGDYQYHDVILPAGWQIRHTDNVFVRQLFDADGKHVAKMFYKPTGGTPSVHVILTEQDARSYA
jgi:hypothetical protein